jgi:hypothetical protein
MSQIDVPLSRGESDRRSEPTMVGTAARVVFLGLSAFIATHLGCSAGPHFRFGPYSRRFIRLGVRPRHEGWFVQTQAGCRRLRARCSFCGRRVAFE